ncbi:MAG: ornithine carbamoyltransferase, partial [Anaerolinea sp. 4484_236]
RTRCSFEAGMAQLGGHAAFVESRTTQVSHGDTEKELGEILGRYFDGIAIRHCDWGIGNSYLNNVASASRSPVLNMQCEIYHPHQCLADLMTIQEKKGKDLRGKKIVVSLSHPPEFALMPEIMEQAQEQAEKYGVKFDVVHDMEEGFADADVVYAKSWGPLMTTQDPDEGKRIQDQYKNWITDSRKMALAAKDAIYMHPLPADRDVEVKV